MNRVAPIIVVGILPALVAVAGERASLRFLEFFAANIRNPHTRRAYMRAVADFCAWCAGPGRQIGFGSSPNARPMWEC